MSSNGSFSESLTEKAGNLLSGLSNVAVSMSQDVVGVVNTVSTGIGDAVHGMTAGMERLMTEPPQISDDENSNRDVPILTTPQKTSPDKNQIGSHGNSRKDMMNIANLNAEMECFSLSEDYFHQSEDFEVNSSSPESLQRDIEQTKELILNSDGGGDIRRGLVHKLIKLRMAMELCKEEKEVSSFGILFLNGHVLTPETNVRPSSKQFCDVCAQIIWGMMHTMYICSLCSYQCHGKCVKKNHKNCPSLKFPSSSSPQLIESNRFPCNLSICPEIGLDHQDYRCFSCHRDINNKSAWREARLCDYTGRHFCPACHWNYRMVVPARVIHNWDFDLQYVSQTAKQTIFFLTKKPIFNLDILNPNLFRYVQDLNTIKHLREIVLLMKPYLSACKMANEAKLLHLLDDRPHFIDDSKHYSLIDLIDASNGSLLDFTEKAFNAFNIHIREECESCSGKGFICEVCSEDAIIFPFDANTKSCNKCGLTVHDWCYRESAGQCSRCIRRNHSGSNTNTDKS